MSTTRRGFLGGVIAGSVGLVLPPEPERVRVYSFLPGEAHRFMTGIRLQDVVGKIDALYLHDFYAPRVVILGGRRVR